MFIERERYIMLIVNAMSKTVVFLGVVAGVAVLGAVLLWPMRGTDEVVVDKEQGNYVSSISARPFMTTDPITSPSPSLFPSAYPSVEASPSAKFINLIEPTIDFKERVTKKPFGIYVTPEDSPVEPERFTGFHTAADAEYGEIKKEVSVHAISDGEVLSSRRANGYGGVVVIRHRIEGEQRLVIYGHLDPENLIDEEEAVKTGEKIGVLGDGYSEETDGERKHLHLGIVKNANKLDVRGYVGSKDELEGWLDPLKLEMRSLKKEEN